MIPTMTHKRGKVTDGVQRTTFGKAAAIAVMTIAIVTLTNAAFVRSTVTARAPAVNVNVSASLRLTDTGQVRPRVKAFGRLQLQVGQGTGPILRAAAQAESDGLTENRIYGLWVSTRDGTSILIDTGRADEECDAGDCETIVDLRGHILEAPANLNTLEGLTIDIREHSNLGLFSNDAPVVATGTVATSDSTAFVVTSRAPNVSANVSIPSEGPRGSAATIRSQSGPPGANKIITSRLEEEEDEERRLEEEEEQAQR